MCTPRRHPPNFRFSIETASSRSRASKGSTVNAQSSLKSSTPSGKGVSSPGGESLASSSRTFLGKILAYAVLGEHHPPLGGGVLGIAERPQDPSSGGLLLGGIAGDLHLHPFAAPRPFPAPRAQHHQVRDSLSLGLHPRAPAFDAKPAHQGYVRALDHVEHASSRLPSGWTFSTRAETVSPSIAPRVRVFLIMMSGDFSSASPGATNP